MTQSGWSGLVEMTLCASAAVACAASSAPQTASSPSHAPEAASSTADEEAKAAQAEEPMVFQNPVLPGTNPDPSAVRVGDDYYLVVSSFEYFPGVPIYKSGDLVHWEQLGYVLTRKSQLDLEKTKSSHGVFAPTLRYHDGTFYMVTTDMAGGGSFYVTAKDPAGPWSDPVWVKEDVFTMDPSLFFDDDGKVYYTRHGEQRHGGIFQAEIDIETGKLHEKPREIWRGTGGIWPEGPHLYKKDGTYYLLISEGGTSYGHKLTVARASDPFGPFEPHPQNPILTHEHLPDHPIQALGHADLLQTADGDWWTVLLGIRPSTERHHHIGRETFLAPVTWSDGWPVINAGNPLELQMSAEGLPPGAPTSAPPARDDFDGEQLRVAWRHVRNPSPDDYSLTARPGFLRLSASDVSLKDIGAPTLVVQPQTLLEGVMATEIHATPQPGQEAGLVVRGNEDNHYALLLVGLPGGKRAVVLRTRIGGETKEVKRQEVPDGPVELRVTGKKDHYAFSYVSVGAKPVHMGRATTTAFAYEKTQSFTGAFVGLYAQAEKSKLPFSADFDWFEMKPR